MEEKQGRVGGSQRSVDGEAEKRWRAKYESW